MLDDYSIVAGPMTFTIPPWFKKPTTSNADSPAIPQGPKPQPPG